MRITPRMIVVLACAWCGLPLLWIALRPVAMLSAWAHAPLNLVVDVVRVAFVVTGGLAYARRPRVRWLAMALAVAWTAMVIALAILTPFGMVGFAALLRPLTGGASALPVDTSTGMMAGMMSAALALLAWAWLVAFVARRVAPVPASAEWVSRSFGSRDAAENRLIWIGLALIAAGVLAWPRGHNVAAPLREIQPGIWLTDAAHARIVLTDAQRQSLSPGNLRVVDDVNDDIAHLAAGQPPLHASAAPGTHFHASNACSCYFLIAQGAPGKPSQITLGFYGEDLRKGVGGRTFLIR